MAIWALATAHAGGDAEEDRRQTGRIDGDEERHEGGEEVAHGDMRRPDLRSRKPVPGSRLAQALAPPDDAPGAFPATPSTTILLCAASH